MSIYAWVLFELNRFLYIVAVDTFVMQVRYHICEEFGRVHQIYLNLQKVMTHTTPNLNAKRLC